MLTKVVVGSIPEKITYIYSASQEVCVGCQWDIDRSADNTTTVKQIVVPAFPAASNDAKAKKTGIDWVKSHIRPYNPNTQVQELEVDNKNITNIQILSLEERGNGGRAYKALVNNFYVDLREDVVLDAMLQVGIQPGGILNGNYLWAKIGSHTKLIREGSELHRLVLDYMGKNAMKTISKKALEVGGVYQDKKKNKAIFLGYVNTIRYVEKKQDHPYQGSYPGNYQKYYYNNSQATFDYSAQELNKIMLFYTFPQYIKYNDHLMSLLDSDVDKEYHYHFKSTHKYIEKVDQAELPDDLILNLRNAVKQKITKSIVAYSKNTANNGGSRNKGRVLDWEIIRYSQFLNMYKYGDPKLEPFDGKKYLIFV